MVARPLKKSLERRLICELRDARGESYNIISVVYYDLNAMYIGCGFEKWRLLRESNS